MDFFEIRTCCPLCSSDEWHQHFCVDYEQSDLSGFITRSYAHRGGLPEGYLKGGFYDLNSCHACGLIFQSCIPSGPLLERIYNPIFSEELKRRKSKIKNKNSMKYVHSEARQVVKTLKQHRSPIVLDFGVGYGIFAKFILDQGIEVHGTELNEEALNIARKKGVKILTNDQVTKFEYDFINTEQVLEHVVDPYSVINLLASLLKDNGILKISVPNAKNIILDKNNLDYDNPKLFGASTPLQHINVFTDAAFRYIAKNWDIKFTRPIQFDSKFPVYTLGRTLRRRMTRDSGTGWFKNDC